ncbi:MAG: DUF58 domain-containing protein [Eubacteriales bacterium]|nr:DUF58 domain-containing protein [Eubacteriales bacterium]
MITARGIGWLILILITWGFLAYSGLGQLQLILMLLLLLPLLSVGALLWLRTRLKIEESLRQTLIRRGDQTSLVIRLTLASRQIIGLAEATIAKPGQDGQVVRERRLTALAHRGETTVALPLSGVHRGIFRVGLLRLRCRDVFGLVRLPFYRCQPERLQQVLTVLPRPYAFDPLQDLSSLLQENQLQKAWKPGSELDAIANIRQQQPGDALKRAHWKLSARLDELMIREFENPLQQDVLVLCDLDRGQADKLPWDEYNDYFADSLAWLIEVILRSASAVRLVFWPQEGRREARAGSLDQQLECQLLLSSLSETGAWNMAHMVAAEWERASDCQVFILATNRLDDAVSRQLTQLAMGGVTVWLILLQGSVLVPRSPNPMVRALEQAGVRICRSEFSTFRAAEKNRPAEQEMRP